MSGIVLKCSKCESTMYRERECYKCPNCGREVPLDQVENRARNGGLMPPLPCFCETWPTEVKVAWLKAWESRGPLPLNLKDEKPDSNLEGITKRQYKKAPRADLPSVEIILEEYDKLVEETNNYRYGLFPELVKRVEERTGLKVRKGYLYQITKRNRN